MNTDGFKGVNNSLGHLPGDVLLRSIGELLWETFRTTDIIGRLGGDEFMVFVKGSASGAVLKEKCRTIQNKLRVCELPECSLRVTCSVGRVLVKRQRADCEHLFRQADGALYQAKPTGKNRVVLRGCQEEQLQPYSGSGTGVTKKSASGTETPKG